MIKYLNFFKFFRKKYIELNKKMDSLFLSLPRECQKSNYFGNIENKIMNRFILLPKDCKIIIFCLLDKEGIVSAMATCREWNSLINDDPFVFKTLCKRLWNSFVSDSFTNDWKYIYKMIGM